MKRIVVAYNERSSRVKRVESEVLDPLFDAGFQIVRFKVQRASVDQNAEKLCKILKDGDLVIAAGGDGTATAALNGVILSGKKVRLAVLPYGNFNDTARLLGTKRVKDIVDIVGGRNEKSSKKKAPKVLGKARKLYPLEMKVDEKHFRYAACYFTLGMFAESTRAFNEADTRENLVSGQKSLAFSLCTLFSWWLKNRKRQFLPTDLSATDIIAVNGRSVAKIMKGRKDIAFSKNGFLASKKKLSGFMKISWFMLRSMIFKVPGKLAEKVKVEREEPFLVEVQAEGEYEKLSCRKIEIMKAKKPVEVICRK